MLMYCRYTDIRDAIDVPPKIKSFLDNRAILLEAKDLFQQLEKVSTALNKLQGNFCSLADACAEWVNLLNDASLSDNLKQSLRIRFDKAMTPAHFLALLTSNDEEKVLMVTPSMKSKIRDWLSMSNNDLDLMAAFAAYEVRYRQSKFEILLLNIGNISE